MTAVLKIKKRNGAIVDFDTKKIANVIEKAFAEVLGDKKVEEAQAIAASVTEMVNARYGGSANFPNVEEIQDLVERAFMSRGYFEVAKSYIIYRYEHAKMREERVEEVAKKIEERGLLITRTDGTKEIFSIDMVKKTLELSLNEEFVRAVDMHTLLAQIQREVYDGITTAELERTMVMAVRSMIERDPAYAQLGAQLVLNGVYKDALQSKTVSRVAPDFTAQYRAAFVDNIKRGVAEKLYDERLLTFDLEKVAAAIEPERDGLLKYMGVSTLADRYLVKSVSTKKYFEAPQHFWMRIAIGVALAEKDNREAWAVQFYNVISKLHFVPSTPTLFHAGLPNPQLSSCYLNVVEDDLDHIFKVFGDNAQLSKWAGGIGTAWSKLRGTGALIKKAGIHSQGVIPFLKIANDVTVAINRSGRRRGATAVYLETWHYDIEEFLELRKNTGDERRRTHDMNTANWIPDLFMKRVREDGQWTLFSPDEATELTETFGKKFEEAYVRYEQMADRGEIKLFRRIKAADLWKKMLGMLFETGHPWVTFKDPSNIRSPQDHVGVVHNSNLCTEITLNTSREETAVCNLGWVNFARHVTNGAFDTERVKETVSIGMRMLDNVIDVNFYPTKEARFSNMKHRPVGLGVGGFQDALYQLDIDFASERAVQFADTSMELISYYSILASVALAKERGAYESFKGSKWDRGLLPIDTIRMLEEERGEAIEVSRDSTLDWGVVRTAIKQFGMRNSNCMAIAPTASTSNIVGAVPSIEPIYKNIYVESNISGDFTVVNPYLVEDLKKIGMWNESVLNELKYQDGSVARIAGIPEHLKNKYKEVFEIDMRWLVRSAAYRAKWIDQSQSLNIFFRGSSGKELSEVYFYAWKMGLKTTYYLRTLAATQVEKSTVATQQFGSTHKRDDVSQGLDATATIPIALTNEALGAAPVPSQYQAPVTSPLPVAPVVEQLSGVGAAIAPAHEVTAAESRAAAPVGSAWSTTPLAEKPKFKLHRAPEVTCESCQ